MNSSATLLFARKHIWALAGVALILGGVTTWFALILPMALSAVAIGCVCVTVDLIKHYLYLGGAAAIIVAFALGFLVGNWAGQPYEIIYPREYFDHYCLFTWQNGSGDLCFKLILRLDRAAFIHKWNSKWSAQCGPSDLERTLAALPQNTHVAWENWPPRFTYPSPARTYEVINFAKSKNIRLELSPVTDQPVFPKTAR